MKRRERRIRQGRGLGWGGQTQIPVLALVLLLFLAHVNKIQHSLASEWKLLDKNPLTCFFVCLFLCFFFFSFILIIWRLITLQYCSGFCHTLT